MSSRYGDNDGEGTPYGLWRNILNRAMYDKRGQAALRELEQALLALPQQRLIAGELCDRQDVCVVGALGLHRLMRGGLTVEQALEELPHGIDTDHEIAWYGERELKLTQTLAWELGRINDEQFQALTPEARYERMLGWVRMQIAEEGTNG